MREDELKTSMREIKFRAWDKNSGTMFYGVESGVAFDDGSHYGFEKFLNPPNDDCHDWIVMQFTGLLGKNGKEIYEGDIVKFDGHQHEDKFTSSVVFVEGKFCDSTYHWELGKYREVIGNIHENPELLQ